MRVPVLGLVVLMAAGCGAAAPSQAEEDATVKVGAIISQTGVYAPLGEDMETAMRLYLDENGGRLGGRPASLVVADDAGNPEKGRQRARELIAEDRVDVITGLIASPVAVSVADEAAGTPVVIANAGADQLGGRGVFRVSYTNRAHGYAAGRYAAERFAGQAVVLMASDYSAGQQTLDGFEQGYGEKAVKRILTPFGQGVDLAPYMARIPAEAELVYAFYAGGEADAFLRAYRQHGYQDKITLLACGNLTDEDVARRVGADADGIVAIGPYSPALDNPDNAAFVATWRARTGRNPSMVAAQSWDAMRLIDRAVAKGGDLTGALGRVTELPSPRGTVTFDETHHNPVQNWYATLHQNGVNRVIATIPPEVG
ncbi:ABC transporter substrate-binding protein [Nonomuraea sp. NN258]|uniref:ABC transporter substrate-binding protein n=1 Tax=Nonomuraea antri TaxID=2730852 RepID=UPI00156A2705|nr:ABC transporter substrate-binding protein [Nonomuraea antri]NRQ35711.1 ABC transporter substrate-binding protein [Nonomuraea antri]